MSVYNTRTCELQTEDLGVREFGEAMNLISVLQECYSEGSCYFMEDRDPAYCTDYMEVLCTLLNRKFTINSRAKLWDMLIFTKENPECDVADPGPQLVHMPWDYCDSDNLQWDGLLVSDSITINEPKEAPITERAQIPKAEQLAKKYYLYQTMAVEYQKDKEGLKDFLKRLLDLPLADRAELAKSPDAQGIIAEVSLYVYPVVVVKALAQLEQKTFWDVWDSLNIKGYRDIVPEKGEEQKSSAEKAWDRQEFYEWIMRSSQDEFLEFWDGGNLVLSSQMQKRILEWKRRFDETKDQPDLAVEEYLADILSDMKNDGSCHEKIYRDGIYCYVDLDFVKNVLNHKENSMWRRALLVLRKVVDDGLEKFPELDRQTAVRWGDTYRPVTDIIAASAYCSLMTNASQRQRIFGF